ncbi:protein IL-40 isoform X2 [Ursus americanus]|uniref:protein IL-40 isoform X2 n=1 Tax=Ursus americanus TaxID=9643 RepID=UPI001E67BD1C|nr:protein IL-40 isoform X2 [Ursus americanus]
MGCCGLRVISLLQAPTLGASQGPQSGGGAAEGAPASLIRGPYPGGGMRLLLLFCWAMLAASSFSVGQEVVTPETFIAYKVLEVFPRGRRVVITCHSPQAPPPVTYSLWGSQGTEVAKKAVKTGEPASFSINITLKSRPDLLAYSCQAASPRGVHSASTKLQMYWELWTKPVSQLQANFTLLDKASGPRVEISCQVSSGSPPITYSLVGKDGSVHTQQRPNYGQPANFSFALTNTSNWLQCQAENDISVQSSPFKMVPPGQLPQGAIVVLTGSLTSIAAVTSWLLGPALWTRL